MKPLTIVGLALFAVLLNGSQGIAQGLAGDRHIVTISLVPETALDDTVVYLDQIAKLSGGPIALRQRLARLDVAEFKLTAERTSIFPDQVRFRLMLAGINETQFQLSGARRTVVTGIDEPITARKILAVAEKSMRAKNPNAGAPRDIIAPLLDVRPSDRVQYDAKPPRPGQTRLEVLILVNGKLRETVPVSFESNYKNDVVKAAFTTDVRGGTRPEPPKEKSDPLIKARDLVRMVIVVGVAQITATGEAQQDGRLGEVIRVRNVETNRIVNARVESRDVVSVDN